MSALSPQIPTDEKRTSPVEVRQLDDGSHWVFKDSTKSSERFGDWSLSENEIFASELARFLSEVRIPRLVRTKQGGIRGRYRGESLWLRGPGSPFRPLINTRSLGALLAFSHWIGDTDRTVHHVLLDGNGICWGIDYEFCGPRPDQDRYPDPPHLMEDPAHFACAFRERQVRPLSPRLAARFPRLRAEIDRFPWNASAELFLGRFGISPDRAGAIGAVAEIEKLGPEKRMTAATKAYSTAETRARAVDFLERRTMGLRAMTEAWLENPL